MSLVAMRQCGNVSQGNDNRLDKGRLISIAAADLDQFVSINLLAAKQYCINSRLYSPQWAEVESLAQESEQPDYGSFKGLYKKYAWATIPLKALLAC